METQTDPQEVVKKIYKYLQTGAKNIEFESGWEQGVNEYCDNFFGKMINGFSDRDWVCQVDWTTVVMAAIRESFPRGVLSWVDDASFANAVGISAERAFEEARYWYGTSLWEVVNDITDSKATQKRIRTALDDARKEAWDNARHSGEDYLRTWISGTIRNLSGNFGSPDEVLPMEKAAQLFVSLVGSGALPIIGDIGQEPQRDDWSPFILPTIQEAYAQDFTNFTKPKSFGGGKGKGKGHGNQGYSPYGGNGSDMMGGGKGKGKGFGGDGSDMMGMMEMFSQFNQMMGMMNGGKGEW